MANQPRYRVPDELRETLLDFTIAYLLERPANLVDFGIQFFQRIKGERDQGGSSSVGRNSAGGGTLNGRSNDNDDDSRRRTSGGGRSGGNAPAGLIAAPALPHQNERHDHDQLIMQLTQVAESIVEESVAGAVAVVEDGEPDPPPPVRNVGRRKSVFAEAYNPEEDEDDKPSVVHPKSDSQRSRLAEAVKHILLFRSLDAEQMQEVIDAMFERKVTAGEYVIKQGDDGDNFYVIESGKYKVFVKFDGELEPKHVGGYDGTGSFGELALMYNTPRAATVQADSGGSLWAMDRQTFRRIVLKNAYKKRQMYETLIEAVPMLRTLENYERMNLADALVPRVYTNGETIIKQGDAADGMYFVEDGDTRVVKVDGNGEEKEINRASKGGYFGELALLTKKPRAASVIAAGNVKLAFLDVDAFERLLGPCMEIMIIIDEIMMK